MVYHTGQTMKSTPLSDHLPRQQGSLGINTSIWPSTARQQAEQAEACPDCHLTTPDWVAPQFHYKWFSKPWGYAQCRVCSPPTHHKTQSEVKKYRLLLTFHTTQYIYYSTFTAFNSFYISFMLDWCSRSTSCWAYNSVDSKYRPSAPIHTSFSSHHFAKMNRATS